MKIEDLFSSKYDSTINLKKSKSKYPFKTSIAAIRVTIRAHYCHQLSKQF